VTMAAALGGHAALDASWFAVWTRNQYEPRVEGGLRAKRVEAFLPVVRVPSRRRDRRRTLEQPLFPGYLFARFAPSRDAYLSVATTEGVVRILGEGWDALCPVPEAQMDAIRRLVAAGTATRAAWLREGDRVRIVGGPLAGLEGLVQTWRGARATFVVNVDILRRAVAVEVAADLLDLA